MSFGRACTLTLPANVQEDISFDHQKELDSTVPVTIPGTPALIGPKLRTATIRVPVLNGNLEVTL